MPLNMVAPDVRLIFVLVVCSLLKATVCLQLQTYSACYGSLGLSNFLQPSCDINELMFVREVYANAKPLSSNCPQEITPFNSATTPNSCCIYDTEDCETLYDTTSVYASYYSDCNYVQSCVKPVSWLRTPCNESIYIPRTHYMVMNYYCVSEESTDLCSDITVEDTTTFLTNIGGSSGGNCSCSVEVSCDTTITITALDLRFSDVGGVCQQRLDITDGANQIQIDCNQNNAYLPTLVYTSTSHFIEVTLTATPGSTFVYSILIEGLDTSGNITLSCGSNKLATPHNGAGSLLECPNKSTITSTEAITTVLSSTHGTTAQSSSMAEGSTTGGSATGGNTIGDSTTEERSTTGGSFTGGSVTGGPTSEGSTVEESTTETFTALLTTTIELSTQTTSNQESTSTSLRSTTLDTTSEENTTDITNIAGSTTDNQVNNTNDTMPSNDHAQRGETKEDSFNYIWVIPVVLILIILCLGSVLIFHHDKIRECLCGEKRTEDQGDEKDHEDVLKKKLPPEPLPEPDYDKLFNLDGREQIGHLPPVSHALTFGKRKSILKKPLPPFVIDNSLNEDKSENEPDIVLSSTPQGHSIANILQENGKSELVSKQGKRGKGEVKKSLRRMRRKHRRIYQDKPKSIPEILLNSEHYKDVEKQALHSQAKDDQRNSSVSNKKVFRRQSTLDVMKMDGSLERTLQLQV